MKGFKDYLSNWQLSSVGSIFDKKYNKNKSTMNAETSNTDPKDMDGFEDIHIEEREEIENKIWKMQKDTKKGCY